MKLAKNYKSFKRILDFVISLLLLFLSLPLWLLLVILVKLNSPGPAIFKQRRIGKDGKEFLLYKLRTMDISAPAYAIKPNEVDPRITKIGRFLRKSGLDELPQLYNVLEGNMSLVGPRPEMPFMTGAFKEMFRERVSVKPGITGLWQISGKTQEAIYSNLEFDLEYVKNQCLLLDFKILLNTLSLFLRMLNPAIKLFFLKMSSDG